MHIVNVRFIVIGILGSDHDLVIILYFLLTNIWCSAVHFFDFYSYCCYYFYRRYCFCYCYCCYYKHYCIYL